MRILVTGASSGIGRAVAQHLHAAHNVLGTYMTGKDTYPHKGEAEQVGFTQTKWDVRQPAPTEIERFLEYRTPCSVIHCAGITYLASYETMDMSQVQAVVDTNIMGTINVLGVVARKAQPGSTVTIVSSVAAYTPMRLSAAYNASKAGQDALVRQAAREFGSRFSVIGIRPGYVQETKLADYVMEQACGQRGMTQQGFHDYNMKTSITGRYPTMQEVVDTIAWAATAAPAQALTGSFLNPSCGS
jgi:NAD(P)-dependent dehydrogenase (short-subunit alcohol dehydrogenase family)